MQYDYHLGIQHLIKDLNAFYRATSVPALDNEPAGFEWIDGGDYENSILTFMRKGTQETDTFIVACNFTPIPRYNYRIGVNDEGMYEEVFNSDDIRYHGTNVHNIGELQTESPGWNFKPFALQIVLPPLGIVVFQLKKKAESRKRE